jgi:hypothetical protein
VIANTRLLVQVLHRARAFKLRGVFGRQDRGEIHREVGDHRRFGPVEDKLHRHVVNLNDLFNEVRHRHGVEVLPRRAGDVLMPRMIRAALALEREDHVIRVHVAGGREEIGGVKLDTGPQMERVFQPVARDVPALRKRRDDIRRAALEFHQAIVDRARRCVERGASGVEAGVEAFRRAFRAMHERFGRSRTNRHCPAQGDGP